MLCVVFTTNYIGIYCSHAKRDNNYTFYNII